MLALWFIANTLLVDLKVEIGGLALGFNVILLTMLGLVWKLGSLKIKGYTSKVLLGFMFYLVCLHLIAIVGPCTDQFQKSIVTGLNFFFLILCGLEIGLNAKREDWLKLNNVALWVLLAAFIGFAIEIVFPGHFPFQVKFRSEGKYSGFFDEPSHVAYSLFPCIAILLVAEDKKTRIKGAIALLGLLIFSRSSTLFMLIIVWSFYTLYFYGNMRKFVITALVLSVLLVLGAVTNYDIVIAPFMDRVLGVFKPDEVENLSSLVYIQGWQDASANLLRTKGLGLGFNMMGCAPTPDVLARSSVFKMVGLELNTYDGSFFLSKLISEAGIIGGVFFMMVIWKLVQFEKENSKNKFGGQYFSGLIMTSLMFSFVSTSIIRSAGYFTGGALLWVVALGGSVRWYKEHSRDSMKK